MSLIVELGCRERAFFARRTTRRAYLRVGVQASLSAIGARCRRVGSPRAGVRPIQRLNSGPPAPLSQPHSGCRSCARRSQTREAEAADSARGPRGARAALETCRGGGAARRAPSSERPVFRVALPVVEARRVNEHESLGGHARRARHIDLHNSAARAQGQRGEDVLGALLAKSTMYKFDHTGQGTSRSDRAPRESDYSGGRTTSCVRTTSAQIGVLADLIHIRMQLQIPVDLGRMND